MGEKDFLGMLELTVMLAVAQIGKDAYGMTIRREIAERTGRDISIGAVYATLDRLEEKGYIKSWAGEATPERGGRAKKYFRLLAIGNQKLEDSRVAIANMATGLDPVWEV